MLTTTGGSGRLVNPAAKLLMMVILPSSPLQRQPSPIRTRPPRFLTQHGSCTVCGIGTAPTSEMLIALRASRLPGSSTIMFPSQSSASLPASIQPFLGSRRSQRRCRKVRLHPMDLKCSIVTSDDWHRCRREYRRCCHLQYPRARFHLYSIFEKPDSHKGENVSLKCQTPCPIFQVSHTL